LYRKSLLNTGFLCAIGALALLCALPPVAQGAAETEFWEKSTESWFEPVGDSGTIFVHNPYGAIYARFGGYEAKAEIIGTSQRLEPEMPKLIVERNGSKEDLYITVREEGSEGDSFRPRRDRVDLVLFVPIGRRVDLRTNEDTIAAKGVQGDLVAHSVSGDISLRKMKGSVNAYSDRGRIQVLLESAVTKLDQSFETVTGDIEMTVYEDAKLDVAAATSGMISTDFSIKIEHRRFEEPGKHASAVINGGGAKLTLRSKRGQLSLLRQQKFFTKQEIEDSSESGGS